MSPRGGASGGTGEVFGVEQAVGAAQDALDGLGGLWVRGEVFEYRGPYRGSGHYYFKLRDANAQLDVKMWAGTARRGLRCELAEGMQVLAHGRFDVWPKRGNLSFVLDEVIDDGAGDLARRFEQLKQRLRAEGLFEEARKRPLPARPGRVALITAHPSAAAADVLRTWEEGAAPFRVLLRPARVQGAEAVADLCAALEEASRARPDVVLLARGGGSLEDLWAFNEEAVVRAVAACPVPVVSAVGHESDFTLTDFAADHRAKTPTAGAVGLLEGWREARRRVTALGDEMEDGALAAVAARRQALDRLRLLLREQRPSRRVERLRDRVERLHGELGLGLERRLRRARARLERAARRLAAAPPAGAARPRLERSVRALRAAGPAAGLQRAGLRLEGLGSRLRAGSPTALLERGYALVEAEGRPGFLRRAGEVAPGERIRVRLAAGELAATVDECREAAGNGGPGAPERGE